jgi:NADH-quinone oxidoreductase subunit G
MFGSMAKKFLPSMLKVNKKELVVVSVMPCTAKKMEAKRPEFIRTGMPDVDHVITTGELGKMIANAGIQFAELTPESFDLPFGFKTGGGILFGNSGGVMEAALRHAYEEITGDKLLNSDFEVVRGEGGLRTIEVKLPESSLKVGVAHSLSNARKLCEQIKSGESDLDFIEMMACPGGCVNGGGQPVSFDKNYKKKRTQALYNCDKQLQLHKSQDNPYLIDLYKNELGEVGGKQAHHLLHTAYKSRKRISKINLDVRESSSHHIDVTVCVGTNCYVRGSQDLLKKVLDYVTENRLEDIVGFEQQEETVDVKATFCYERCDRGPVVKVNHKTIEKADFEKVKTVLMREIEKLKVEATV